MNKTVFSIASVLLLVQAATLPCRGQWLTQRIPLVAGWNAVYLEVQPEPRACEAVFKNVPVQSVWKWDRRFSTIQFTVDPATLLEEAPDWLVWLPASDPRAFLSRLFELQGCQAYLIKVASNAVPFTLAVKGRVVMPRPQWYPHGLNLVGFPVNSDNPPTFSEFFKFTPEVDTTRSYANELYRLDSQGWGQRIVQPARERMQAGVAYWIGCGRAPEHPSALDVSSDGGGALDFGTLLVRRDVTVKNVHPSASFSLSLRLRDSEQPPAGGGYAELAGPVPLSYLTRNASNEWEWQEFPVGGVTRGGGRGGLGLWGVGGGRADLAAYEAQGSNGALYQSILEVSDVGRSLLIRVPVTVQKPLAAGVVGLEPHHENEGLWVGQVTLDQVNAPAYAATNTTNLLRAPAPFSFRLLVHVDGMAQARLLQQVVLAWDPTLTSAPHTNGTYALYASERAVPASAMDVSRISSAAFPTMGPVLLSGQFSNGLTGQVTVGFADPSNPFLHRYHPMHDNLNWDWEPYDKAVETRGIGRDISLSFSGSADRGANPYYGADTVSGDYQERLTELRAQPVVVRGVFTLQRISRINQLQGMTP